MASRQERPIVVIRNKAGESFAVRTEGYWLSYPGTHGLYQVRARRLGDNGFCWGGVLWKASGQWRARLREGRGDYRKTVCIHYFNSEKDAKQFLESAMALVE